MEILVGWELHTIRRKIAASGLPPASSVPKEAFKLFAGTSSQEDRVVADVVSVLQEDSDALTRMQWAVQRLARLKEPSFALDNTYHALLKIVANHRIQLLGQEDAGINPAKQLLAFEQMYTEATRDMPKRSINLDSPRRGRDFGDIEIANYQMAGTECLSSWGASPADRDSNDSENESLLGAPPVDADGRVYAVDEPTPVEVWRFRETFGHLYGS